MDELVRKVKISPAASAREAMRVIDQGGAEIGLVIDDAGYLLGTVTDGDLRRAILRNDDLNEPVTTVMNARPRTAAAGSSKEQLLDLMRLKGISQVPLVDAGGRVTGLALMENLIREAGRENGVVIMAGGIGSRLRPLTDTTPKPLLTIGDRPLLEIILEQLRFYGFRKVFLSISYQSEKIRDYFQDGTHLGVEIRYLEEDEPLGTAGSLRLAAPYLTAPFIVMNGDLLTKLNFGNLLEYHQQQQNQLTVCCRMYDLQIPYGVVNLEQEQVVKIEEKPQVKVLANGGIYVINPPLLKLIPGVGRYDMTELLNAAIAGKQKVGSFLINEYWLDIGQLKDYERANRDYEVHFRENQERG